MPSKQPASKRKKGTRKRGKRMIRATYPNGRVEVHEEDGRTYPPGTKLEWDVEVRGRKEMRWCVTGGGWPFDD